MSSYARSERYALCDTLLAVGPQAPTLCEGWLTRDLAAHLVLRERRPDAAPGMVLPVPVLAGYTDRLQSRLAGSDWARLVSQVRSGPPSWHPARLHRVDEAMNTAEMFVHHEDVRRGGGDLTARELSPGHERALWTACGRMARLTLRRAPVGVTLLAPGYGRVVGRSGEPQVRVEGAPGELLLFVTGRRAQAHVRYEGPPDAVERLSRKD